MSRVKIVCEGFRSQYVNNGQAIHVVRAPGRVNLIGEHTDYNDGFVFPVAIDRDFIMVAQPRTDREISVYSLDLEEEASFSLDQMEPNSTARWINYIMGVASTLENQGIELCGMNMCIQGDVPQASGLSSSAALEVGTAFMLQILNGFAMDECEMARICQQAENNFVGVKCGIMDQFVSRAGRKNHALFLDCRSLVYKLIPMAMEGYKLVVADTRKQRGLVDSEYNARREECQEGITLLAQLLKRPISALRDVGVEEFNSVKAELPEVVRKRCAHVIDENQRVLDSILALQENNWMAFGRLMNRSHASLRDLYQVSCFELDTMVELARSQGGVVGSRMTGAGFGGCTVSLVEEDRVEEFVANVTKGYREKTGLEPAVYVCTVEDGAREVRAQ